MGLLVGFGGVQTPSFCKAPLTYPWRSLTLRKLRSLGFGVLDLEFYGLGLGVSGRGLGVQPSTLNTLQGEQAAVKPNPTTSVKSVYSKAKT